MNQQRRRWLRGVTLLELMAGLAIAGILGSLSVVGYQEMLDVQKRSSSIREVLMQAQEARNVSRTKNLPTRLSVRTLTRGNKTVKMLRWEQLGCQDPDDQWGGTCPSDTCRESLCSTPEMETDCICPTMGDEVEVPPSFDIAALDGLCWLGDDSRPVKASEGANKYCDETGGEAPADGDLAMSYGGHISQIMMVDGMTGEPSLFDCDLHPADVLCKAPELPQ